MSSGESSDSDGTQNKLQIPTNLQNFLENREDQEMPSQVSNQQHFDVHRVESEINLNEFSDALEGDQIESPPRNNNRQEPLEQQTLHQQPVQTQQAQEILPDSDNPESPES